MGTDEYLADFIDFVTDSFKKRYSKKDLDPKSVDELFQNEKYINETKKSFLRFSSDYSYDSIGNDEINVALRAKIALNKSNHRTKLFLKALAKKMI